MRVIKTNLSIKNNKLNEKVEQSNFNKSKILRALDHFVGQITVDKENEKEFKELLNSKNISFMINDRNPGKLTFKLKYDECLKEEKDKKRIKIKNCTMLSKGGENAIVEEANFNSLKKRISKFTPNVSVSNSNSKKMFELHDDISNNKNLTKEQKRELMDMLLDRLEDKKEEFLNEKAEDNDEDLENPSEDMPAPGVDTGIADQLITLINGEWDTIKDYNSFIATIADLDTFQEATDVIKDIVNEEHLHVGQLQALLQKVSPNTSSIAKGEEEGREQIEEA